MNGGSASVKSHGRSILQSLGHIEELKVVSDNNEHILAKKMLKMHLILSVDI